MLLTLIHDPPVGHHAHLLDIFTLSTGKAHKRLADDTLVYVPDVLRIEQPFIP